MTKTRPQVERFSTLLRLAKCGDCEDFARNFTEICHGVVRNAGNAAFAASTLCNAALHVLRCYVPMTVMGAVRFESVGAQYAMKSNGTDEKMNAHSFGMVVSTFAMAKAASSKPRDAPGETLHLDKVALMPWSSGGLPPAVVDGTRAHTVFDEDRLGLRGPRQSPRFVMRRSPLDLSYFMIVRSAYVLYGIAPKAGRVYELFFCSGRGDDVRYGVPVEDLWRMAAYTPPDNIADVGRKIVGPGGSPWLTATTAISQEDLGSIRPIIAMQTPYGPYEIPTGTVKAATRMFEAAASREKVSVAATRPKRGIVLHVRYDDLAASADSVARSLRGKTAHCAAHEIIAGAPMIAITIAN